MNKNNNTIHPLASMKGEKPMNLDTFLPKDVADQLGPLMNRMRPLAQRVENGEKLDPVTLKEYGQMGQQAVELLTGFLARPDCPMNRMKAAGLIAKGARIHAIAKSIEDGAGELLA